MKANQLAISIFLLLCILSISITAEDITMIGGLTANQTNATMPTVFQIENKTSTAAPSIVKENEACIEQYECLLTDDGQHYFDCYYDLAEKKCKCFVGQFTQCKVTNNYCSVLYECKEAPQGEYYFDCYLDKDANNCKCFIGAFGRCRMEKSSVKTRPPEIEKNETINTNQSTVIAELPLNQTKEPAKKMPVKEILFGGAGAIVILLLIVIILAILVMRMRNTPENNLRRARNYHHKAEKLHEKGKDERAKHYYALAEKYRKKALRRR